MKTVLITGGTGLVGRHLTNKLRENNFDVRILSQRKSSEYFYWNPAKKEIDEAAFENLDVIIHLAGASISKRWTNSYKKILYESRVLSANLLFETVKKTGCPLNKFITASGVNYYGTATTSKVFTEEDPHAADFLGNLCAAWEAAAKQFESIGCQVCSVRTGVVLSPDGGMLKSILPPAKFSFISPLGSGQQIVPWIHLDDLAELYLFLLQNEKLEGAFNAVATEIVTSKQFTESFVKALGKRIFLPNTPAILLQLIFGETASIMLKGSAVSNEKIKNSGFGFQFENLDAAMKDLLN